MPLGHIPFSHEDYDKHQIPTTKTQQDERMKSDLDELALGMKMNQALIRHMDKDQIRTKKYDMPSMQRFELSTRMRSSY